MAQQLCKVVKLYCKILLPRTSAVSLNVFTHTDKGSLDSEVALPQVAEKEERDTLYKTIEVEVRGHDAAVLKSYEWFAIQAAKELDISLRKKWIPPKHFERMSILKSAHVHGKHKVQYEIRTHFRVLQFQYLTGSTASTYLEYIQRNLPEGVAMKVTKCALETIPTDLQSPLSVQEQKGKK